MGWIFRCGSFVVIHILIYARKSTDDACSLSGTWTTPESANIDRNNGAISFSAAGVNNIPLCLKWMLAFEEPETRTLWLAKATPRDWLDVGEAPLVAHALTTRYGRVSLAIRSSSGGDGGGSGAGGASGGSYMVKANITLPAGFAASAEQPSGGVVLRLRVPLQYAGKLSSVTVGGKAWAGFSAAEETVTFSAKELTPELLASGLPNIRAVYSSTRS